MDKLMFSAREIIRDIKLRLNSKCNCTVVKGAKQTPYLWNEHDDVTDFLEPILTKWDTKENVKKDAD